MNTKKKQMHKSFFMLSLSGMLLMTNYNVKAEENAPQDEQATSTTLRAHKNQVLENAIYQLIQNANNQLAIRLVGSNNSAINLTTLQTTLSTIVPTLTIATNNLSTAVAQVETATTGLATQVTTLEGVVNGLATSTQVNNLGTSNDTSGLYGTLNDIEGISFVTGNDSLHIISGKVATATNLSTLQATANTINTNVNTANTSLSTIEGTGFTAGTDDLHSISTKITASTTTLTTDITNATSPLATATSLTNLQNSVSTMAASTNLSAVQTALATDITASTNTLSSNITNATNPLATTTQLNTAVSTLAGSPSGTTLYTIATDITNATSTLATATNLSTLQSTANTINTSVNTANTSLSAIEGTGFSSSTDSLHVIAANIGTANGANGLYGLITNLVSQQAVDPILRTTYAQNAPALTTTVTSADSGTAAVMDLTSYTALLGAAMPAVTTALTPATQNHANTVAAQTAVTNATNSFTTLAAQWATDSSGPSSAYSAAQIKAALTQLSSALTYLLSMQP